MEQFDPLFDSDDEDAGLFADNNQRERKLWGKLLSDKRFLQVRGYAVWKDRRRIVVDGRRLTLAQFGMLVCRTRRDLTT